MSVIALLFALAVPQMDYSGVPPLPQYNALPAPSRASVAECQKAYMALERFNGNFKAYVTDRELNRGGRLQWSDANSIRYTADLAARNYFEAIRKIAYRGEVENCRTLVRQGIREITLRAINPVFGHIPQNVIMNYRR